MCTHCQRGMIPLKALPIGLPDANDSAKWIEDSIDGLWDEREAIHGDAV